METRQDLLTILRNQYNLKKDWYLYVNPCQFSAIPKELIEVEVPNNNSLFYAVALGFLLPVLEDEKAFAKRFHIFERGSSLKPGQLRVWLLNVYRGDKTLLEKGSFEYLLSTHLRSSLEDYVEKKNSAATSAKAENKDEEIVFNGIAAKAPNTHKQSVDEDFALALAMSIGDRPAKSSQKISVETKIANLSEMLKANIIVYSENFNANNERELVSTRLYNEQYKDNAIIYLLRLKDRLHYHCVIERPSFIRQRIIDEDSLLNFPELKNVIEEKQEEEVTQEQEVKQEQEEEIKQEKQKKLKTSFSEAPLSLQGAIAQLKDPSKGHGFSTLDFLCRAIEVGFDQNKLRFTNCFFSVRGIPNIDHFRQFIWNDAFTYPVRLHIPLAVSSNHIAAMVVDIDGEGKSDILYFDSLACGIESSYYQAATVFMNEVRKRFPKKNDYHVNKQFQYLSNGDIYCGDWSIWFLHESAKHFEMPLEKLVEWFDNLTGKNLPKSKVLREKHIALLEDFEKKPQSQVESKHKDIKPNAEIKPEALNNNSDEEKIAAAKQKLEHANKSAYMAQYKKQIILRNVLIAVAAILAIVPVSLLVTVPVARYIYKRNVKVKKLKTTDTEMDSVKIKRNNWRVLRKIPKQAMFVEGKPKKVLIATKPLKNTKSIQQEYLVDTKQYKRVKFFSENKYLEQDINTSKGKIISQKEKSKVIVESFIASNRK